MDDLAEGVPQLVKGSLRSHFHSEVVIRVQKATVLEQMTEG
jgi:hypothetical protein